MKKVIISLYGNKLRNYVLIDGRNVDFTIDHGQNYVAEYETNNEY